ncbi:MAG: HAD-IC family P-type ATPase [Caldilineaceae bacterium]|nr:HAD-IC family P-type ATPase [Caldilineaceae bacterium]MBP8108495.1 HAD-IC family P-type ATPase [Caldilineaceae bacterium]MBP8123333.1 HAD-IC family P-type ATPase [Caldilineaceae bacterium]MBP9072445.1 HAD-IC family P-type ATPase [Caldilineaceae bacterium]
MEFPQGLTQAEVLTRRGDGRGNQVSGGSGRTYGEITRANLFSYFNIILFSVGAILAVLGQLNDAFITAVVGFANALISTIQEIRAKRQLDQIAVVARPTVTVVRDGHEQEVGAVDLVQGDIVRLRAGDQAVVDGRLISGGPLEMDESLLTGESDLIRKHEGDEIFSGSFCVTGDGFFEALKVGQESFANQLTAAARIFEPVQTPLQKSVNYVVQLLLLLAVLMGLIFYVAGFIQDYSFLKNVKATAVLIGLVPYGLFLTIAVAYALGSVTIAKKGALVQQSNAVESLNSVDVLCMDKTGTLTSGRMTLDGIKPLGDRPQAEIAAALGAFVRSASATNTTSKAILDGTDGQSIDLIDEVPFSSARKWSALAFGQQAGNPVHGGVYVLGAVEMLAPYLASEADGSTGDFSTAAAALAEAGLRVLLFAHNPEANTLHDANGDPALPPLTPLALVSLSDELRPQAKETLRAFAELGVDLKIISGDNPHTVAALAKQAGFHDPRLISGAELASMSKTEVDKAVKEVNIFGRVTPDQKQALVNALIEQGHYVAMIGDGVNDVLSMKKANLGIAMQSGSNAARNVADMVLLGDSYAALVPALSEGKRIANGIADATYLLVGRGLAYALIIIGVMMVGLSFPFEPSQLGLTTFSVGLPAFMLTIFALPEERNESLLSSMVRFVLPFTIWTMLLGVGIYAFYHFRISESITTMEIPLRALARFEEVTGLTAGVDAEFTDVAATLIAQTTLSNFVSIVTMLLVLFLHPPLPFFTGWRPLSHDRRPAIMTVVLIIVFMGALSLRPVADYFGVVATPVQMYVTLGGMLLVWTLGFRFILRSHWGDSLLFSDA